MCLEYAGNLKLQTSKKVHGGGMIMTPSYHSKKIKFQWRERSKWQRQGGGSGKQRWAQLAWFGQLESIIPASNFQSSFSGQLSHQGNRDPGGHSCSSIIWIYLRTPLLSPASPHTGKELKSKASRNHKTFFPQGSWAELGFSSKSVRQDSEWGIFPRICT